MTSINPRSGASSPNGATSQVSGNQLVADGRTFHRLVSAVAIIAVLLERYIVKVLTVGAIK